MGRFRSTVGRWSLKAFVYDNLLLVLEKGAINLQFDETFMSAKRKRAWRRQKGIRPGETPNCTAHQEESFTSVGSTPV